MKKSVTKQIMAVALSLIMLLGIMPTQAFAISYDTYDVSYRTQSGDNRAWIRYGLTDSSAGSFSIVDQGTNVQFNLSLNDGWYLEKWDTWFNGGYDKAYAADPSYNESNPVFDGFYTFFNTYQTGPLTNAKYMFVGFLGSLYGDFRIDAIVRPILTVNAGDGASYQIFTSNPLTAGLSGNQVAVVYGGNAEVKYSVDEKYVVTGVSANYATQYSDNGSAVSVSSIIKPATINISTRLKQQKVNFDANGGTGSMAQQVFDYGVAQSLTANVFAREGYTFAGWTTGADGTGTSYTNEQSVSFAPTNDGDSITLYAQWTKKTEYYTVGFDTNGGAAIDPITVTHGEKYGRLPSSSITGLSGGDSNWYLVDKNGNVTETKITKLSTVEQARNHTLFVKRKVLAPNIQLTLSVPDGISDSYNYYIPGNSTRILTATIGNQNSDVLDYTYQWYKDGVLIENENGSTLTLPGNVSDAGIYKVIVTAMLKDGTGIVTTFDTASAEKELAVKILRATNELKYDANGGEGGPSANYTGGTTATVSEAVPTREHYVFLGWNTKADGIGDSYAPGSTYTFVNDGGNGGCVTTLYAQWKIETKTVTYMVGNEVFKADTVEYGKDAVLPDVPTKEGYTGKWDHDGKNITEDTVINARYTINKYTVTFKVDGEVVDTKTVEYGDDATAPEIPAKDGYTAKWDSDGKNITADTEINAVYTINEYTITYMDENGIYTTQTYKHGEKVTMPEVPTKKGYTVKWDTTIDKVTGDATIKAVYTENSTAVSGDTQSPQTGDNSNMTLWIALLLISSGALITLIVVERKRKHNI